MPDADAASAKKVARRCSTRGRRLIGQNPQEKRSTVTQSAKLPTLAPTAITSITPPRRSGCAQSGRGQQAAVSGSPAVRGFRSSPDGGTRESRLSITHWKLASPQKVLVAALGHPFRARQMAFKCPPSAPRLANGIDMQHDPRDLLPIRTFGVGVEQTQIGDSVFVVVWCQHQIGRRGIGDIRIKRGLLHGLLRTV